MRILVTGGAGFIGSNFVRYILKKYPDYKILVLDALTYAGRLDNLQGVLKNPNLFFYQGDIRDKKIVENLMSNCDTVVHFAAETHVDRSVLSADSFITTDVYGTYVLLEAARKFLSASPVRCPGGRAGRQKQRGEGIKKFLHISTDEVYGEALDKPCSEEALLKPKSPYAASKCGGDRLAFSYWTTYNLPVIIGRCSNNYGPNQYPEKMIPLFITAALEDKPLPVYGRGTNTRDWIYVLDHCEALDLLLHSKGLEGEVFNIGSGEEYSILEIAQIILNNLGKPKSLIQKVLDRPGHVKRHAVNTDKIKRALGFKAKTRFELGIKKTVSWYKENKAWWKKIKHKEEDYQQFQKIWYEERR